MGIQSSINLLLSQAQSLATFYKGFDKADKIIGDTIAAKGEAQIQTDIAAGNAPMKDGKVDPEWLKKRREEIVANLPSFPERFRKAFNIDDKAPLTKEYEGAIKWGIKREKETGRVVHPSAALWQVRHSELKNKVASDLARASVEARTASINKTKSNFNEHTASLIRYYGKGSGNP